MLGQWSIREPAASAAPAAIFLTARQAEVLQLAARGLSGKQIARYLGISVRTVEDHFSAMRLRTGAHSQGELIARGTAAGLVKPRFAVPETVISGTSATGGGLPRSARPENQSRNRVPQPGYRDGIRDDGTMTAAPAYDNSVRIGYARVSTRAQEHQAQLDALAAAHCREIIIETASTRGDRPRLREALGMLQAGDTLVIYKPDRVARSMKELLVLLEDQLHARGINLHILTGICAGIHRPDGTAVADKMLFMVAAMAAEMERDLIRERTLDGLRAAQAQGRRGGRPAAVNDDILAIARDRQSRGESVTAIARHLKIGRSTLYRALQPHQADLAPAAADPGR
ncbi:MAG TPA: recombinase family protein [Streptosporangiaceae bacterium]|nr:recombinase family protein [Streptosporangiaceae bacterium]